MIWQFIIYGLINGSVLALAAIGFSILYSSTKIFNIALAGIYTFSAYMLFSFFTQLHFSLFISIFIALLLTVITNIVTELLFFKPLEKMGTKGGIFIITSIGIYTIFINIIAMFYGNESKIIFNTLQKSYSFGNIIITNIQIYQFFVPLILLAIFLLILHYTDLGRDLKAMSDNPILLKVLGANIWNLRIIIFGISAFFLGSASILTSLDVGMDPYVGMNVFLNAAVAVIMGGVGNLNGVIKSSFILALIQALVVYKFPSKWEPLVTFTILILVLLIKPQGIFSDKFRVEQNR